MGFMRAMGGRIIRPEILDDLALDRKRRSLEDLTRLNRQSGRRPLRRLLEQVVRPNDAFTVLDIGAASGDLWRYARELYPGARVTSLDYRPDHLTPAPCPRVCADAFRIPFEPRSYDFVFSSLFLHHFSDDEIVRLLSEMARVAARGVLAIDLYRHPIAYYFVPVTAWLYGWDPITVHDGPISVEAAFRPAELEALAGQAGLIQPEAWSHGWSFRVSLFGRVKE